MTSFILYKDAVYSGIKHCAEGVFAPTGPLSVIPGYTTTAKIVSPAVCAVIKYTPVNTLLSMLCLLAVWSMEKDYELIKVLAIPYAIGMGRNSWWMNCALVAVCIILHVGVYTNTPGLTDLADKGRMMAALFVPGRPSILLKKYITRIHDTNPQTPLEIMAIAVLRVRCLIMALEYYTLFTTAAKKSGLSDVLHRQEYPMVKRIMVLLALAAFVFEQVYQTHYESVSLCACVLAISDQQAAMDQQKAATEATPPPATGVAPVAAAAGVAPVAAAGVAPVVVAGVVPVAAAGVAPAPVPFHMIAENAAPETAAPVKIKLTMSQAARMSRNISIKKATDVNNKRAREDDDGAAATDEPANKKAATAKDHMDIDANGSAMEIH